MPAAAALCFRRAYFVASRRVMPVDVAMFTLMLLYTFDSVAICFDMPDICRAFSRARRAPRHAPRCVGASLPARIAPAHFLMFFFRCLR